MKMTQEIAIVERSYPLSTLDDQGHRWGWLDTGGPGREVVLLHGSAADAFMFTRTIVALGEQLRLVSVTIPAIWEPARFSEGLLHVIDAAGLDAPVIVGSSMGAYLAPFFAAMYPSRTGALLLGNGFVDAGDLAGNPLFDLSHLESTSPDELHREWTDRIAAAPESDLKVLQQYMIARKPPESLKAHFLTVVRAKPCPPLGLDTAAITVLACEDDPVIPAAARERARAQFPGAELVSMASGGHYPHILNAAAYQALLLDICRRDPKLAKAT
jgi:pimeloyl-ACP methyl ester carboxylesterase